MCITLLRRNTIFNIGIISFFSNLKYFSQNKLLRLLYFYIHFSLFNISETFYLEYTNDALYEDRNIVIFKELQSGCMRHSLFVYDKTIRLKVSRKKKSIFNRQIDIKNFTTARNK